MARPNGSKKVGRWMITPEVAKKAGVSLSGELSKEDTDKLLAARKSSKVKPENPGAKRITVQDVESEPWKYTADVYASIKGADRPVMGEVSGTQLSRMSKKGKDKYLSRQKDKRQAFEDARKEWGDKVWDAYQKGQFKLSDVSSQSGSIFDISVRGLIQNRQQQQKKARVTTALKQNAIFTVDDVNVGDRVFYKIYNQYGTIAKKNKNTVRVTLENGQSKTVKPRLLDREEFNDLQDRVLSE